MKNLTIGPYWAKKSEKDGAYFWLSLDQHLKDTSAMAGILWDRWLSQSQKTNILKDLDSSDPEAGKNLTMFVAFIHDFGKLTPYFQAKKSRWSTEDLEDMLIEKLIDYGHLGLDNYSIKINSASSTLDKALIHHSGLGHLLLNNLGLDDSICVLVSGHHGKALDTRPNDEILSYPSTFYQDENDESVQDLWKKEQKKLLDLALSLGGYASIQDVPSINHSSQIILSGLVIMADWLASNEDLFPLAMVHDHTIRDSKDRAELAWQKWNKSSMWIPEESIDPQDIYKKRFSFIEEPKSAQDKVARCIAQATDPGIAILEAPMGMGKTEAALVMAEIMAFKTKSSGLYFALPTQATSNAIFPRIKNWLEGLNATDGPYGIGLVHSKAHLNDDYMNLMANTNEDAEVDRLVVNEWFSGSKRSILNDFVIGTVDQVLMMALKTKHLMLRHLGLSKKVVIIDEIHSIDLYMSTYMYRALEYLGYYHVPVVILSATLPAAMRENLVRSYMKGRGVKTSKIKENLKNYDPKSYPILTYSDSDTIKFYLDFAQEEDKKVEIIDIKEDQIIDLAKDAMASKAFAGIIVNSVKKAQEIAKTLAQVLGEDQVILIHSRFIDSQRPRLERQILDMVGKGTDRSNPKVVVGTQVLQESLDIDFDLLITELSPMDLLIQRIGRLHRHKANDHLRPDDYKTPKVYLLGRDESFEFDEASMAVYGGYILARTQHYLKDHILVPSQISDLVQNTYQDEDITVEESLQETYDLMKIKEERKLKDKEFKANTYKVNSPKKRQSLFKRDPGLMGWQENPENSSEAKAQARVRDIQDSIEIIALKKIGDGYGIFGTDEDISGSIGDYDLNKKLANETIRITLYGNIDQVIDELEDYNLNYLANWQDEIWLQGSLGLVFDEENRTTLGGVEYIYDEKYGLIKGG